jgi:hypothetical protein
LVALRSVQDLVFYDAYFVTRKLSLITLQGCLLGKLIVSKIGKLK